ncbi:MAG: hypothetical protein ACRDTE_19960, partial [Pseudonocardiaceae bacterium]
LGLGVTQHIEQPVDPGQLAVLLHRGHAPILATTPDSFGPAEPPQTRNTRKVGEGRRCADASGAASVARPGRPLPLIEACLGEDFV